MSDVYDSGSKRLHRDQGKSNNLIGTTNAGVLGLAIQSYTSLVVEESTLVFSQSFIPGQVIKR